MTALHDTITQSEIAGKEEVLSDANARNGVSGDAKSAAKELTKAQRRFVDSGCIHGDFSMVTVRALKAKGLMRLVIDSPNGQCGFMRLTPFGEQVQALLKAADGASRHAPSPATPTVTHPPILPGDFK